LNPYRKIFQIQYFESIAFSLAMKIVWRRLIDVMVTGKLCFAKERPNKAQLW